MKATMKTRIKIHSRNISEICQKIVEILVCSENWLFCRGRVFWFVGLVSGPSRYQGMVLVAACSPARRSLVDLWGAAGLGWVSGWVSERMSSDGGVLPREARRVAGEIGLAWRLRALRALRILDLKGWAA